MKVKKGVIKYVFAWFAYLGSLFTAAGSLGDVITTHFDTIKPPKRDEYY